jgi:hypothetical protein
MPAKILLGELFGLELSAKANTIFWAAILGLGLFLVGVFFLNLTLAESLVGAIVCILLHYVSELVHQLGHAGAARRAGYPMRGVRFWGLQGRATLARENSHSPGAGRAGRQLDICDDLAAARFDCRARWRGRILGSCLYFSGQLVCPYHRIVGCHSRSQTAAHS